MLGGQFETQKVWRAAVDSNEPLGTSNFHNSSRFSGSVVVATPVECWLPRNNGQASSSCALAAGHPTQHNHKNVTEQKIARSIRTVVGPLDPAQVAERRSPSAALCAGLPTPHFRRIEGFLGHAAALKPSIDAAKTSFNRRSRWRGRKTLLAVLLSFSNPREQPLRGLNKERCLQRSSRDPRTAHFKPRTALSGARHCVRKFAHSIRMAIQFKKRCRVQGSRIVLGCPLSTGFVS